MRMDDPDRVTTADLAEALRRILAERRPMLARLLRSDDLEGAVELLLHEEASQQWIDEQMEKTRIKSMDFREGVEMELEPAREMAAAWVAAARALLMGGENYSESTYVEKEEDLPKVSYSMDVSIAELPERYTLTVQRVAPGKLTPHEARQRAEGERDRILEMIAEFQVEANDVGGVDVNDLVYRLEREGFALPDHEGEEEEE